MNTIQLLKEYEERLEALEESLALLSSELRDSEDIEDVQTVDKFTKSNYRKPKQFWEELK